MIRLHDLDLDLSATSVPAPDRAATRVLLAQRLGQPAAGTGAAQGAHGGPGVDCALPALTGLGVGAASDHWLGGDADLPTQAGETAVAELIDAATDHPAVAHATVRWRQRGDWLAAAIDLPEADEGEGLQALADAAYDALFALLQARGTPHVLRFWNYLARINEHAAGLERYRRFNRGRQDAFARARRNALEGSPAASAVGSPAGAPLQVRVIASASRASLPVENPRQVSAYHYPSAYGPVAPSFSRAALLPRADGGALLAISGTASILGHATVHVGDVRAQTHEACRNLQAVLAAARAQAAGRTLADLRDACLTIYVRHPQDAPAVAAALAEQLGEGAPALATAVWLQADICRDDLLVEIEGVVNGAAPG
ncbi:chorismate transformation enzyme, FkbO/Hyg5 family [Ottowia oryzae]